MRLTTEEVRHIALLARVGMTDEEVEKMRDEMSHILDNFDILNSVDTSEVQPTSHSVALDTVTRPDKSRPSMPREDALANAPITEGEFIRIKAVLEE